MLNSFASFAVELSEMDSMAATEKLISQLFPMMPTSSASNSASATVVIDATKCITFFLIVSKLEF